MKWPFKINQKKKAAPLQLTIPKQNDEPGLVLPEETIDNMRQVLLRIEQKDHLPARLAIVAALRGEGVSYVSQALAATIAHDLRARVGIVELNWWWPSTSPLVSPDHLGLGAFIAREAKLDDVVIPTGWPNLSVLPPGAMRRENRPILARSQELREAIEECSQRFDHLILDIPAILACHDAVPLASLGESCCMVIQQGVTGMDDVHQALDQISHMKVLGVIMNRVRFATPKTLVKLITAR